MIATADEVRASDDAALLSLIPNYDPFETAADCLFDYDAAQRVLDWFPAHLVHIKGKAFALRPFVLQPWQAAILANLFGWIRPDGTRRYRETFIFVPRKNGKTTLIGGAALYLLGYDDEPGVEGYSAAGDATQARIMFDLARAMVGESAVLRRRYTVWKSTIVDERSHSFYAVINSAAETKHGLNPHFAAIDELRTQKNRELVDVLDTAVIARTQPISIKISTAGYDRESVCFETYRRACAVRDGVIEDPYFLPVIYEATAEDDWTDEAVWAKANPNLGVSISLEALRESFARAQESPSLENRFRNLHLNQWTEQAVRFISLERWDACLEEEPIPIEALREAPSFAGLDMSTTTDLTAFAIVFLLGPDRFAVRCWFWVPGDSAITRETRDRVPYRDWIGNDWIRRTEGDVVDYDRVRADVLDLCETYGVGEVAVDRWNATQIMGQLENEGLEVVGFGQGFRDMSAPTKRLEALVLSRGLIHDGNPVLRWNVSNLAVAKDAAENLKPDKGKSTDRIDGAVAVIMALGRALVTPKPRLVVYSKDRGLRSL